MIELIYSLALITIGFLVGMEYGEDIKSTCKIFYNTIALTIESYVEYQKTLNCMNMFGLTKPDLEKAQQAMYIVGCMGIDMNKANPPEPCKPLFNKDDLLDRPARVVPELKELFDDDSIWDNTLLDGLDDDDIIDSVNKRFPKMYPMNAKIQGWNFEDESIKEFQAQCTFDSLLSEKCLKSKKRSKCEIDK